MNRLPDWEKRLNAEIEAWRHRIYVIRKDDSSDCMMFTANCIVAVTGEDPAAAWRDSYHNEAEAQAILDDAGGAEALVTRTLGIQPVAIALARRGDIVLGPAAPGPCLGRYAAFMTDDGLTFRPLHQCLKAWRIGEDDR